MFVVLIILHLLMYMMLAAVPFISLFIIMHVDMFGICFQVRDNYALITQLVLIRLLFLFATMSRCLTQNTQEVA